MDWEERQCKMKVRKWLLERIPGNTQIDYLGLPAGQAIFEKMLSCERDVRSMTLIEKDPETLSILEETVKNSSLGAASVGRTLINTDIDNYIHRTITFSDKLPFNFIWLDYCGAITPERLQTLRLVLSKRPENGIVAVTFMAGREKARGNTLLDFFDESYMGLPIDYEKDLVPSYFLRRVKAVSELARSASQHIDIAVLPYRDSVPMMLFVFNTCAGVRPVTEIEPYLKE